MQLVLKILLGVLTLFMIAIVSLSIWLKTTWRQNVIEERLSELLYSQLGIKIQIEQLSIALPLVVKVGSGKLYDAKGEFCRFQELSIKILPSLSLKTITVQEIVVSALDIKRTDIVLNTTKSSDGQIGKNQWFNPKILIQAVNMLQIKVEPLSIHNQALLLQLQSSIEYNSQNRILQFAVLGRFAAQEQDTLGNTVIQMEGSYDSTQRQLVLDKMNMSSDLANLSANLKIDNVENTITGKVIYAAKIDTKIIQDLSPLLTMDIEARDKKQQVSVENGIIGQAIISGNFDKIQISTLGEVTIQPLHGVLSSSSSFLPRSHVQTPYNGVIAIAKQMKAQQIKAQIKMQYGAITTNGVIEYKDNIYFCDIISHGSHFDQKVNMVLDPQAMLVKGNFALRDRRLSEISNYLPFVHNGEIDIRATFSSSDNIKQKMKINCIAKKMIIDLGINNKINIDGINFDFETKDLWQGNISKADLVLQSMNISDLYVQKLKLAIQSRNNLHSNHEDYSIQGSIACQDKLETYLDFDLLLRRLEYGFSGLITKVVGSVAGERANNIDNIVLEYDHGLVSMRGGMHIGRGMVSVLAKLQDRTLLATLNLKNISGKIFVGLPAYFNNSLWSGVIVLRDMQKIEGPILAATLEVTDIELIGSKQKLTMKIENSINQEETYLNVLLHKSGQKLGLLNFRVKNVFSLLPFVYTIKADQVLDANVFLSNEINILSLLSSPQYKIEGTVAGHMSAQGTAENYKLSGHFDFRNGKYIYKNQGILLKNIEANIQVENKSVNIKRLTAKDDFGNSLHGSGSIMLAQNYPFHLSISTDRLKPISSPYMHGEVNGHVRVEGNSTGGVIKGHVNVGPFEIKIPERFQQDIPELNIVKLVAEQKENAHQRKGFALNLDVSLKTNKGVFIRGWGLEAQLAGALRVKGLVDNPEIYGTLESTKGKYQEFGRLLNIKKGSLVFDGPLIPSPNLNVVGVTRVGSNELSIILSGPIMKPELSIESNPPMLEEQALSVLLFGEKTDNISAVQALQLANSARRLSNQGSHFDPLGLSKKILRVDDINFKEDARHPGQSRVGIGKYITDTIYLEVEQGAQADTTRTRIEIQVTPKLSVENINVQEGNTSFGVNWRFDY